jgi:hypothetical protein
MTEKVWIDATMTAKSRRFAAFEKLAMTYYKRANPIFLYSIIYPAQIQSTGRSWEGEGFAFFIYLRL